MSDPDANVAEMTIDVHDAKPKVDAGQSLSPSRQERRSAIVLLVCVMVAIGMIGLLLDSFTDSFRNPKPASADAAAVPIPGAHDDFRRADDPASLGMAQNGHVWRAAAGTWGIAAKQARVVVPPAGPSLATLPVGDANGRVEVVFARVAAGSGVAFRCRNALNCWHVEAVPQFGTWNVIKVVKGSETRVTSLGTVPVADGTRIAIDMNGSRLTFFVNGKKATSIDDGDLAGETRAGLSLREPSSAEVARWSSFVMEPRLAPGALNLRDATIYDNFSRTDATGLGTIPSGPRWISVSGGWAVSNGMAASARPATDRASLALVDLGSADGVVQVSVVSPQNRSGLAFRCRDLDNCWRLEAVPGFGTWAIYEVVDGKISTVDNLGLVSTRPGTTLSVGMHGARIDFFVDGRRLRTLTDATFSKEQRAGLVVEPGRFSASTRWSAFAAKPDARS